MLDVTSGMFIFFRIDGSSARPLIQLSIPNYFISLKQFGCFTCTMSSLNNNKIHLKIFNYYLTISKMVNYILAIYDVLKVSISMTYTTYHLRIGSELKAKK